MIGASSVIHKQGTHDCIKDIATSAGNTCKTVVRKLCLFALIVFCSHLRFTQRHNFLGIRVVLTWHLQIVAPWFQPSASRRPLGRTIFLSVSLGGLLLRFLLCLGPTLPRIPDNWVRYKVWLAMTYQESIWLPCLPGISSVLKHCWNARRGKMWKYWLTRLMNFTAKSNKEMCETFCAFAILSRTYCILHTEVTWVCVLQLLDCVHHVPRLLPGAGQRC